MSAPLLVKAGRLLSLRRLALLAGVAGLAAAVMVAGTPFGPRSNLSSLVAPAYAQSVQRPAGFADVVEKVKPAVIAVRVRMGPESGSLRGGDGPSGHGSPFEEFFRRFDRPDGMPGYRGHRRREFVTGQGSGFFISADGFAVTNNHVVDKAEKVEVTTDSGKTYTARVIGTDPRTDLALIKVDDGNAFPFVRLATAAPRVGDWVLAVGNPFGLGGTVTAGIVSARGRDIGAGPYDDFIQIDAPVNKGNSGGPAFDVDGNVIGVNTAIFSPSGGSVGIAFAIPAETVKTVVAQLKDHGAVTRGWIGVQIQPVTADIADSLGLKQPRGALVAEPQAGSPANKAGIRSGDVIVSVDGAAVDDARTLARRIGSLPPGTTVKLGIIRDGREQTVTLTLGQLPRDRQAKAAGPEDRESPGEESRLGLTLAPASAVAGAGGAGLVVVGVDPDGSAAAQGVKTGDVILEAGGKAVAEPADLRQALSDARGAGTRTILLRVKSGEGTRFVAVPLGNA